MPSNPLSPICCPTSKAFPKAPTNKLRTRQWPPLDGGDVGAWQHKVHSPTYRRKVKKAVEGVQLYRLLTTGSDQLDSRDIDAIHRLLDSLTFDANRRTRTDGGAREVLEDPVVAPVK